MKQGGRITIAQVVAIAMTLALIAAILYPFVAQHRGHGRILCLSNVKQLALGVLMYAEDHDNRMPDRDSWMDAAQPYLYGGRKEADYPLEHCPAIKDQTHDPSLYGYAFNSPLSRAWVEKMASSEQVPMLYDSINLARNASDPFASLPVPGRHEGRNYIAFADGHAKSLPSPAEPKP